MKEVSHAQPNPKRWRSDFEHLVAYVGVIGSQEGIDVLLRVVDYIVNSVSRKDIKFIIIGTGPHLDKMNELCKSMGLESFAVFTGYIPYEDFYEVLATSDVCINPEHKNSFTDKSTMLKIMDYMTFGKPIVQFLTTEGQVTAADSAVYIRDNDEQAFAHAILELLDDETKRQQMGAVGKQRIESALNWDKQKNNLAKAYNWIMSNPKFCTAKTNPDVFHQ